MTLLEMKTKDLELIEESKYHYEMAEENARMAQFVAKIGNPILAESYLQQSRAHFERVVQIDLMLQEHMEALHSMMKERERILRTLGL